MAEEILVASAQDIVKRLISLGIDEIALLRGVEEEVKKLQSILGDIQLVLQEAEKKQVEDERVRLWLQKLKEAALDAEDILEEFAYDGLRREVVAKRKVRKFFSSFSTIALHSKTAHSIQHICKRLQDIDKEKDSFCLKKNTNDKIDSGSSRDTTSLVDESDTVGREAEKLTIVNMLIHGLGSNRDTTAPTFSVIGIVGLGGLGKTRLAQLVFNDLSVKEHFGPMMIWICVSEDFAITTIWFKILKEIDSGIEPKSLSKQELQKNIQKHLNGKKFLLVLDDFWHKDLDKWEELILPLKLYGGAGSKIVVTTREEIVASSVGAQNTHYLQGLSDDQSFSLFESRAFMQGGPVKTPTFVEIGKEIVKKCGGVPLAVKVLGGFMRSKKTEKEWLAIRDGEIWETSNDMKHQVMEILKLSYNNFPPTLRQCFSYCSIFPKDYEINKHELIQLWMAQGFLKASKEGELMEDVGDEYFTTLYVASFFQIDEKNTVKDTIIRYKMHDLVHDLAQYLSKSECGVLMDANDVKINEDPLRYRHLSLIFGDKVFEIPKDIDRLKKLRSFYLFAASLRSEHLLESLKWTNLSKLFRLRLLRVLDLSYLSIEELSSSIGGLKFLKYLNLSYSKIRVLSSSITNLYNLQTLNLSGCHDLSKLPKNVGNLTRLRHLYTYSHVAMLETPRGLNELHYLQTLDILKLCAESASAHIAELEHLNYLGGTLQIVNLGDVNNVKAVKQANLMGKKNLHTLDMDWRSVTQGDNIDYVSHDAKLLEALQPHPNLKEMTVDSFQGKELPWWMTSGSSLINLVRLTLRNCNKCTRIRSLGELPSLKELDIQNMASLTHIGEDHHQAVELATTSTGGVVLETAVAPLYPCLAKLRLCDVPNLEVWFEKKAYVFPNLQKLALGVCPKLRKLPHLFPSLRKLALDTVGDLGAIRSKTNNLNSLTSLSIQWSSNDLPSFLSSLSSEEEVARILGKNKLLKKLEISGWPVIRTMPDLSGLHFLEHLQINNCQELEICLYLPPCLKVLEISTCPKLKIEAAQLPCLQKMLISTINAFVVDDSWSNKLGSLKIDDVPEFRKLPMEFLQSHKHLLEIDISRCPMFQGFLQSNKEQAGFLDKSSSLEILCLEDCPSVSSSGLQLQGLTQIRKLKINGCTGLKSLEGLQFLPYIEELTIGSFSEELNYFPFLDATEMDHLISSLRELFVYGWSSLKSLPKQLQHLHTLKSLTVCGFDNMVSLPEWLGKLTSLETLEIWDCENLMCLPSANEMQRLTSLISLTIHNCPLLMERCEDKKRRDSDSEWHKISHIWDVRLG